MKKLITIIILIFSVPVIADTYPASDNFYNDQYGVYNQNTAAAVCTAISTATGLTYTVAGTYPYQLCNHGSANPPVYTQVASKCLSGGTRSGSSCINAPACITPTIRSSVTPYACITPKECKYPEVDNGAGICQNLTCPTGQNRNPVTSACQTLPTCATSEFYDISANTCTLYPLKCPVNKHASTTNDACLANAPLVCPALQHDDGTYHCIANDLSACSSNQYSGTINGIPQCITKPNLDTAQQAAADAAQLAVNKSALSSTAAAAEQTAQAALAANPTDPSAIAAATNAAANSDYADAQLATANVAASRMQDIASNNYMQSIDQSLKDGQSKTDAFTSNNFAAVGSPDAINNSTWTGSVGYTAISGTCPAPQTYTIRGETHSMSFQPYCDFMSNVKPVVLSLAFLTAGFIVVTGAKGKD